MQEYSILLIDDREIDLFVTSKLLEQGVYAYELIVASGAKEAIRLLKDFYLDRKAYPDVVLTDFFMPLLDGADMFDAVNKLENFSSQRTSLCVLTTGLFKSHQNKLLKSGVEEVFQKPIDVKLFENFLSDKKGITSHN